MSDVAGPVDYAKIKGKLEEVWQSNGAGREALKEELSDVNKDVIQEKFLGDYMDLTWTDPSTLTEKRIYRLDRYYVTRLFDYTPPETFPATVRKPWFVDPNDYWTNDGYTIPSGYYNYLATYSRASLMYPFVGAYTKLPDLTPFPNGTGVYCGFEHGGATRTGIATFRIVKSGGSIFLEAEYGSKFPWLHLDVTSRLPADYITAEHCYYVKVNRWGAEFFIDDKLVAVALDIPEATQGVKATCPPYAIGVTSAPVIKRLHTLLEIIFPYDITKPNPGGLTLPLSPENFRWGEGEPNPPRALRLYQADSTDLMVGASIGSGSLTSHPVPVYGREAKTFYFRSDQAGTLDIEVLTLSDNWRTYDSVSVSANSLLAYTMTGEAVLARLIFTPSSYPANVTDCEAVLR